MEISLISLYIFISKKINYFTSLIESDYEKDTFPFILSHSVYSL